MIGLIGKKIGMTRSFTNEGVSVPITVIKVEANYVTQIKSLRTDYYNAIQITTGTKKLKKVSKSIIGHFSKSGVKVGWGLWELRCSDPSIFSVGQKFFLKDLEKVQKVDVCGISKGKGFAGTVKRWNFKTQDATHGNSLSHRVPGSIGQNQTPGRVFKGKKMAGHLGNCKVTIQNLSIFKIEKSKNLLLIKGSVPGAVGSNVIIKPAIKC